MTATQQRISHGRPTDRARGRPVSGLRRTARAVSGGNEAPVIEVFAGITGYRYNTGGALDPLHVLSENPAH